MRRGWSAVLAELELREQIEVRLRRAGLTPERIALGTLREDGYLVAHSDDPNVVPWPQALSDADRAEILDLERRRRETRTT